MNLKIVLSWITPKKLLILAILLLLTIYLFILPRQLFHDPTSTVILDTKGVLLGARISDDGQWRFPSRKNVPDKIKKSIIAFEDRHFYHHPGVNPFALLRAFYQDIRAGKIVSGGSTITMQVIRLSRKGKPRTIYEKCIEIILATRLELAKSKNEILDLYCSNAPYGGNVVGIDAASWRYFGTGCEDLSWASAATLAVLPNSPSLMHPGKNRNALLKKRNELLNRLFKLRWINETTLKTAKLEPLPEKPIDLPQLAPHLLAKFYKEKKGFINKTTINASIQTRVNEILEANHRILINNEIFNAAAIVVEVETGNVIAYIGNTHNPPRPEFGNDVDIIQAPRSTGSVLKPVLFAGMLEDGKILPGSLIKDIPMYYEGFSPTNYNNQFDGAVPARNALSRSLNVPAVQMLKDYGIDRFHLLLRSLGMHTLTQPADHYGLTIILGGAEGTLAEMTNIYVCLSRVINHYAQTGKYYRNDYRPLNYLSENKILLDKGSEEPDFLSASSIWFTYNAMKEVNRPEEETGWIYFGSSKKIAWKTGTSFGNRDGWAIGTTPDYVVGVWVGNADGEGRPGLTGVTTAAPILFQIFELLPQQGWFKAPVDEMVEAPVCRESGFLAGQYCNHVDTIKIPINGLKSPVCPFHRLVHLTPDHKYRVNSDCWQVSDMIHESWFVLPPVQEWYYKKCHSDYAQLPPFKKGCEPAGLKSMELIYPRGNAKIYIPVELNGEKGRVIFEAAHRDPDAIIYWHLDDQYLGATQHIHQMEALPGKGKHTLTLVDENGEELVKQFEVIDK